MNQLVQSPAFGPAWFNLRLLDQPGSFWQKNRAVKKIFSNVQDLHQPQFRDGVKIFVTSQLSREPVDFHVTDLFPKMLQEFK